MQGATNISGKLLAIASEALHDLFRSGDSVDRAAKDIDMPYQGVFVTLHNRDELRGCIGYLARLKPLGEAVYEIAQKSATADRRFAPVHEEELDQLSIEITVLEPMEPITSPEEIDIGTHGIYIESGSRRGILLPQVAADRGWQAERFLEAVCEKAMLPAEAWRMPETELKRFAAHIITQEHTTEEEQ